MSTPISLRQMISIGKVHKKPDLEILDGVKNNKFRTPDPVMVATFASTQFLFRDFTSTHDRDKALLVSLGVNGEVPLAQARINAGLPANGSSPAVLRRGRWVAANDNELVVQAA